MRILQYPNELLKTVCLVAKDWETNLAAVAHLEAAMKTAQAITNRPPYGLSANQVGITEARVFVVDKKLCCIDEDVFINPEIIPGFKTHIVDEACMSFPSTVVIRLKRASDVIVKAFNRNGAQFNKVYSGIVAQIIQHELDHLNGITLFQNASVKVKKDILKKIERARSVR